MAEGFRGRLAPTPASRLQPGDPGVGVVDMGDGRPFGVAVTVLEVEPDGAVVADHLGRLFKTRGLLAIGEDAEALLEAEAQAEAEASEETRQAQYRTRAQRNET